MSLTITVSKLSPSLWMATIPRYPQRYAEIMAGRVPLGANRQEMPADLSQTLVGPATAREIGWIKH